MECVIDAASRAFGALTADVAADSTSQNGMMLGYLGDGRCFSMRKPGSQEARVDAKVLDLMWVTPLQVVDSPRSPIDKGPGAAEQT